MLICVDVGNTNVVMGLYDGNKLLTVYRTQTKVINTSDEYGHLLLNHLQLLNINKASVTDAIISSVVPTIDTALKEMFLTYFNINASFVNYKLNLGLKIKLDNPKQLGSDLLVGAYMATKKYGFPCIIIDMGTASTFVCVNSKKEFLGGIIYPGVNEAFRSLIENTSLLEATRFEVPDNIIGTDTASSLKSGMVYGTVSVVEGLVRRIKEELKRSGEKENIHVVMTGGISKAFIPYLEDVIYDKDLLLEGLYDIYNTIIK